MKKAIKQLFFICLGSFALMTVNAQSARSFKQGDNIVSVGYGFPNLGKSLLKLGAEFTDSKVTGIGPIHAKIEHAVSDRIGLAISAGYVAFANEYKDMEANNGNGYSYKDAVTSI